MFCENDDENERAPRPPDSQEEPIPNQTHSSFPQDLEAQSKA